MQIGFYNTKKSVTVFFESQEQVRKLAESLLALANNESVSYEGKLPSMNFWNVRPVKGTKQFTASVSVQAGERRKVA